MFYFETFRIILNPSSVKKIKQHLAMSAIQNHKALWRKKRQCCDAKDVKGKPKTASHVKIAESKCSAKSYADNIKLTCKDCTELTCKDCEVLSLYTKIFSCVRLNNTVEIFIR